MAGKWRTSARLAILLRDWPGGVLPRAIKAAMERLDGPAMPSVGALANWARENGVRRPEGYDPRRAVLDGARAGRKARAEAEIYRRALAWADRVDPDMTLRGGLADRVAQINALRRLEGLPPFGGFQQGERA